MSLEIHLVRLLNASGDMVAGEFATDTWGGGTVHLDLHGPIGLLMAEASDYFEAMCSIRKQLETSGWQLLCYGNSRNVFPSGMSREMGGGGRKAYRLHLGVQAKISDLVDIFDWGPDIQPVSVAEQHKYYDEWRASLPRASAAAKSENPPPRRWRLWKK